MQQNESFADQAESSTPDRSQTTSTAVAPPRKPDRMSCCARFAIFVFGAGAVDMSVFALYSCEFFSYQSLDGQAWEGLTPPFDDIAMASVGMFRYSPSQGDDATTMDPAMADEAFGAECVAYDDWTDIGSQRFFTVGQWCAIVAPLLAVMMMLQIVCECFFCRLRGSYLVMQMSFYAASILQMGSFFVLLERQFCLDAASQNVCSLETGAYYSLAAGGVYMIIAVCFSFLQPIKDVGACGFLGCCIMTRSCQKSAIPFGDSEPQKAAEGDTSDEDDGIVDVASARTGETNNNDDNLRIVNYERNTIPVASADPMSPKTGDEDRYSLAPEIDIANDSDLNCNASPSQLTMETMEEGSGKTTDPPPFSNGQPAAESHVRKGADAGEVVVVEDGKSTTEHSRSPDFLDMCCGDPLELEKYMAGGNCYTTKDKTNNGGSSSKSTKASSKTAKASTAAEDKMARKRTDSFRTSLRKIALVTEASNHEKRSLGLDPDDEDLLNIT